MMRNPSKLTKKHRGQGLVELALFFPILLILISGAAEFGFFLNQYLSLLDASRNAARFSSDGLYDRGDNILNCNDTSDFYRQTACVVNQELVQEQPWIEMAKGYPYGTAVDCEAEPTNPCCSNRFCAHLNPAREDIDGNIVGDDIVVSVFSVTDGVVTARFPDDDGWSYADDWGIGPLKPSRFSTTQVNDLLIDPNAPSTGYILVELFYHYDLLLPWAELFFPNPIQTHSYAFMPLSSAAPTPTPLP